MAELVRLVNDYDLPRWAETMVHHRVQSSSLPWLVDDESRDYTSQYILGIKITKNKAEIPTDQLVTSIMGWDRVVRGLFISDLHPFYK